MRGRKRGKEVGREGGREGCRRRGERRRQRDKHHAPCASALVLATPSLPSTASLAKAASPGASNLRSIMAESAGNLS